MKRDLPPGTKEPLRPLWVVLAGGFLILACGQTPAGSWTGSLGDGSVLKVDPDTHRAMRYYNGGTAPLWDGAHRMEDGSVVIVRDGQAVPTEDMIKTWQGEPGAHPQMRERYCDQLVRKVCGFHDECSTSQPCILARQILRLEGEQQRRSPIGAGPYPQTASSSECLDALANAAFPACKASVPELRESPCKKLVDRVCGGGDRCAGSPACDPARQLLGMENEERLESANPDAKTGTGAECENAMDNPFFKSCD